MSSIVGSILSSTLGLLLNKGRDIFAESLKEGDIVDETFRRIVTQKLNIVSEKLDGQCRAKVLTSLDFLQEGVLLLCASFNIDSKEVSNKANDNRGESSKSQSGAESDILNKPVELSRILSKLYSNTASKDHLKAAIKRFEAARKTASKAFRTETLDLKDRLLAAKVRVVSEVLEHLKNPEMAITSCVKFLENLNALPKIRANFSLFIHGGFKTFKWMISTKAQRKELAELVESVMLINYFIFQFVTQFSDKYHPACTWPTIRLSDCSINPLISLSGYRGEELIQLPNGLKLDEQLDMYCSVVNSQGHIITVNDDGIEVNSQNDRSKMVQLNDPYREDVEGEVFDQRTTGLAVDKDDNIYVLRLLKKHGKKIDENVLVLYVLDKNYAVILTQILNFLPKLALFFTGLVKLAVGKNNQTLMIADSFECADLVYAFSNTGEDEDRFQWKHSAALRCFLCVFGNNEITLAACDEVSLKIYKNHEENTNIAIKLPEGHMVCGVVYHFLVCKIIMLTYFEKDDSYFLHNCCSETGELESSVFFCKKANSTHSPEITSHPSGAVAVVRERSITYL
jgi:hypothetical protein